LGWTGRRPPREPEIRRVKVKRGREQNVQGGESIEKSRRGEGLLFLPGEPINS